MLILLAASFSLLLLAGCASNQPAKPSCENYSYDSCPSECAVCPPCAACSSLSCRSEDFCIGLGFNKSWYEGIEKNLAALNSSKQ